MPENHDADPDAALQHILTADRTATALTPPETRCYDRANSNHRCKGMADDRPQSRSDPRTLRLLRQCGEAQARGGGAAVLGSDAAAGLRPRASDEWRLQPAQGLPHRSRLRQRRREHAPGGRHALADADHARRVGGIRGEDRGGPGHRAARSGGRDPRDPVGLGHLDAGQGARGREGLRRGRHRTSRRELPAQQGRQGLSGRADHRDPAAGALRFPRQPQHAQRAARLFPQARLAPDRGVPDPQPAAPRASGADVPRGPRGPGEPADPSGGGADQAGRYRPLHAGALLRGGARPVPGRNHLDEPAEPRDAHGRSARGGLARHHPAQPRLHPHDRRARPCRSGQELGGRGFLRTL